jgi:hypothetical protein
MCYHILPASGIPIARSSVQQVTEADKIFDEVQQELHALNQAINEKLGSYDEIKADDALDYFDLRLSVMN